MLGTTGEYPSFSIAERKKIAETALKHRDGLSMIVRPGTTNFPETVDLIAHAAANGADGVLIIPPFYYKKPSAGGTDQVLLANLRAIKIPVTSYHIPRRARSRSPRLLHSLEHYPNLAGIKDSTGDVAGTRLSSRNFPS